MEKRQLIEAIQSLNPSASTGFLEQFDADALAQYHARLADTKRRAPQIAQWVRATRQEYRMVS